MAAADWPGRFPAFGGACLVAGLTLVAMAEFVFASLVADRLFPSASRGLSGFVQMVTGAVFVCGAAVMAIMLAGAVT